MTLQVSHVPPGWDSWLGLVGNSQYYHYSVSDNGVRVNHGNDYASDYFTDVIANRSRAHTRVHTRARAHVTHMHTYTRARTHSPYRSYEFLANTTRDYPGVPFFMYLATPASHGPDTAAPQYDGRVGGCVC